jgi:ubiquinone/menaquinone biosynthesis C-methylase UbiE
LGSPEPLPFPDESFDFILANHILEHVPNWWHAFEECARLLKPGGTLEVWGPGMGSDSVLGFRDHINTINQCSFWGINDFSKNPNNAWAASNAKGPAAQLKLKQMAIRLYEKEHWWIRLAPAWLKTWMAHHLRNVIHEVGFEFVKVHSEPVFNNAIVEALL